MAEPRRPIILAITDGFHGQEIGGLTLPFWFSSWRHAHDELIQKVPTAPHCWSASW